MKILKLIAAISIILMILCMNKTNAQAITLINNPDTGSGFSNSALRLNTMITYGNNLYFQYTNTKGKGCLAKYDGTKITLISNPDTIGNVFWGIPIIYNNNMYFDYAYENQNPYKYNLAKYDGTKISLIANPDTGGGCYAEFIVYDSNLYFMYANAKTGYQLAKYNGSNISLLPNPDAGIGIDNTADPIIYNNNLYYNYFNVKSEYCLAKYDGTSLSLITNPNGGWGYNGFSILFGNDLFFKYDVGGFYNLAKYDGNKISLIPNPDAGGGFDNSRIIIYNSDLYIEYFDKNNIVHLAKYDSTKINLINNPDSGNFYQQYWGSGGGSIIPFGNNLYFKYLDINGKDRLAKYDGNIINLTNNPDNGAGCFTADNNNFIEFSNILYLQYQDVNSKYRLAKYDGNNIGLISNPDTGFGYLGYPIIYNSNLYFGYSDAKGKGRLAKLSVPVPLNFINVDVSKNKHSVLINWTTANEVNVANYQVERSYDANNYNTIAILNAYNKNYNSYYYTDDSLNEKSTTVYYRIVATDNDNKKTYSEIRSVITNNQSKMAISPNPAHDKVVVVSDVSKSQLSIVNMKGQVLKTQMINGYQNTINVGELPKGIYIISLKGENFNYSEKLILE